MAKVQESRFALLHVDDDSDEEPAEMQTKKSNQPNKPAQKKSKNKKKKGSHMQAENEEVCVIWTNARSEILSGSICIWFHISDT